jgi:hypothetical protein
VVEVELFGCDLLAQRMERFDLVPGQVEQADLLQVAERLGYLPEVVVGRIEDLELLANGVGIIMMWQVA